MPSRVLHVLSQRPSRTGSGITLDAVVRLADQSGWNQAAVIGIPAGDQDFSVGLLPDSAIHPVRFFDESSGHTADLDFKIPGMSDVMPYPSSIWSSLSSENLQDYRHVWHRHLTRVIREFQPDLIHSNHIWLVSSLLKDVAPGIPVVSTCHATGLRQLKLCPQLASEVIGGCRRNDHFFVLRQDHIGQLAETLEISSQKISLAGVGFRDQIFFSNTTNRDIPRRDLVYVGKFSNAKGLPWLLDAFSALTGRYPDLCLHIAGDGSGPEAEILRERMQNMAPAVVMHGMLDQTSLARLMNNCHTCVLPSFYEGVPLVLVEAAACGCRLVSTELPGVIQQIAPVLGNAINLVPLPRLFQLDQPLAEDLPRFVTNLTTAIEQSLSIPVTDNPPLDSFTWNAVFKRVEKVWNSITS